MTITAPLPTGLSVKAWRNAVFIVFTTNGFAVATLLARMPGLRDHLGVEPGGIGLMLAMFSAGSITGLAFSGPILHAIGARRVMQVTLPIMGVALAGIGLAAAWLGSFWTTASISVLFGASIALCDVALNVEGSAVERTTGRAVMPFLHAGFSLGTVVGAGLGAVAAWLDVPIMLHFGIMGAIIAAVAIVAPRWVPSVSEDDAPKPSRRERVRVWFEPRTLLLGVVVFAFAYTEGAANDWLALGLVDERGFDEAGAAMMLGVFMTFMTVGRFLGSGLVNRFGRVAVLIGSGIIAAAGVSLVIFIPDTWAVVVGTIIWALGSSLGFPVGISAAGDDPATAVTRVSAVSIIAYTAFFAGPPVVGFIADHTGIMAALTIVLGLTVLAVATSPAARERQRQRRPLADPMVDPAE